MESANQPGRDVFVTNWLNALFARLEQRGATYAALRVDSTLFRPGCEIDILVRPSALEFLLNEIRVTCREFSDLRVAYWKKMPRHAATIILTWHGRDGAWEHYFLDIRCGIRKHGKVLLDGGALDRNLTMWDPDLGLRRLRDEYESALLLLRNALDGRARSPRHVEILRTRNGGDVTLATELCGWRVTDDGDVAPVKGPLMRKFLQRSGREAFYASRALWGRIARRILTLNIVIYGPDGVGKTTQADLLAGFFRDVGIRNIHVYHHLVEVAGRDQQALPKPIGSAKKHVYTGVRRPSTMQAVVLLSYLKKLWFVLSRIQPLLRKGHVVIHDRYLLDVFQKFHKTRGVRLPLLERLLPRLTPREPFVMVLQAPPEVVASRTGELSPGEVEASYELLFESLDAAAGRVDGWTIIDTSHSAVEAHNDIIDHVLNVQTRRAMTS